MPKAKTTSDFIHDSKAIFSEGRFDYSRVVYHGNQRHVEIGCPKHGFFSCAPCHHLRHPHGGCKRCLREEQTELICGFGINDVFGSTHDPLSVKWRSAINRCYNPDFHHKFPTYKDCYICDEWRYLSNFISWARNPESGYMDGYELDKDLLIKGNKVYSPDTCCFLPRQINIIFSTKPDKNGLPIGVAFDARHKKYYSQFRGGEQTWLGYFDTVEEAFQAYKTAKESYIKKIAAAYYNEGKITKRVYDALMRYEVEITD